MGVVKEIVIKTIAISLAISIAFVAGYQCKHQALKNKLALKEIQIMNDWERWYKKQIHTAENCDIACPKWIKKYQDVVCKYGREQ